MKKFQQNREEGKKRVGVAEHMVTQTYRELKDPKILLVSVEHLYKGMKNLAYSILYYDRLFKYVPAFGEDDKSKMLVFSKRSSRIHKIEKKYLRCIQELAELIALHKEGPVEFRKGEKLVLFNDNYATKTITYEKTREFLKCGQEFAGVCESITRKNEHIFKNAGAQND